MIEIKDCCLKLGKDQVLNNISLQIPDGSAYGLLGSNGAGKSTLFRIICGIFKQNSGTVLIDGEVVYDNAKIKEQMFFVNDETIQFSNMTIEEMRRYYKNFYPNFSDETFDKLMDVVGLPKNKKLHTFSKGMKRQAVVICGIASKTKYLLLDESFDGLDPAMRSIVKTMIIDAMIDESLTVIFSSHNLHEIDEFCDKVGLLHNGKVVFDRDLDEVKGDIIKVQAAFDKDISEKDLDEIEVLHMEKNGSIYYIIAKGGSEKIQKAIMKHSPKIYDEIRLTLDEIFIYEMEGLGYDSTKLSKQD